MLVVVVLISALFINSILSPILSKKLKNQIIASTDSLYKIDFTNADLSVLQGKVVVYGIKFQPDTAVYNRKKKQGLAPNNLYELQVKKLVVSHVQLLTLYFKKKLNIGRITLDAPDIQVSYHPNQTKDTVTKDDRTPWQKISKSLKLIHVSEIFLNDIHFSSKDYTGPKVAVSAFRQMNLKATDLLIDSATQTDRSRLLYCSDITTTLNNYTGHTSDGLYTYTAKSARLSTKTSRINITGLALQPIKPAAFFNKSQDDRFTFRLTSLQVNNFDFLTYHKYHSFKASNILFNDGTFAVYSNPNVGVKNSDRVVTFPHVAIKQIKAAFNIDTVTISKMDVIYNEFNKASGQLGSLTFNNTGGKIFNITNIQDSLKKNNVISGKLNTLFMQKGKFDLSFLLNLTNPANNYSYEGHLGQFDITGVNPVLMPLSLIKVVSGHLKTLDFDLHATNKTTTGKVNLLYNDLKVNLLRKDPSTAYSKKTLLSFIANTFIISASNPDDAGKAARTANVVYTRPYNAPFFNTMWQALLAGIKPCAGVGPAKPQEVKPPANAKDLKKKEKAEKKAIRKRERAEKKLMKQEKKAEEKQHKLLEKAQNQSH